MNNLLQQAQSQVPSQVPTSHHPQHPGGQGHYLFHHNLSFASPPISSMAMPPSGQSPVSQVSPPPGQYMFNMGTGPRFMPPANRNMLANNNHLPARVPAPQGMASHWNPPSGPRTPQHVANNPSPTQYVHNISPAVLQTPGNVANSSFSTQHVPTSTPSGTYPTLSRPAQLPPQPVPPHGSVLPRAPRPGQASASNGQGVGSNYGRIINGQHLPPGFRPSGYQAAGRSSQAPPPMPVFNGGRVPQFMPPNNSTHQATPPPTRPVPLPMTRYNLPSSMQTSPPPARGRTITPSVVSSGSSPQGDNMASRNSMPPPATNQPATNAGAKRAADQPVSQQPTKRQRKTATPAQKPAAPAQNPSAPVQKPASPAQQPPTTTTPEPVVSDKVNAFPPTWADEPPHLPDYELAKIETSFVVMPDTTKPLPEGKEALAWDQAMDKIVEILQKHCRKGEIMRTRPLARLRELTDAIEEYVARPGRGNLLAREGVELLNVRYVRVIEDGIWDGEMFTRIPERDWGTYRATSNEDREKVVKEAWEKRAREYMGPSLAEAQKQIFKY